MKKSNYRFVLIALTLFSLHGYAQEKPMYVQMADSFIKWHPDSILVGNNRHSRWDYEQGLMLKALEKVWYRTGDPKYFKYIQDDIDRFVKPDGSIRTYQYDDFNLDNIPTGRAMLTLYTQQISAAARARYKKAADQLWKQLENQPRIGEGGYWHKKRYPSQMWLDGLFMAEPFSAQYSLLFNHPEHFADIAKQFDLIEKYAVDAKTGLLYHAYDESREQKWANKKTGVSPNFWGRALGWYAMALVDVLDYIPQNRPEHARLVKYLQRLAPVLVKYQDAKNGLWYQVLDQGARQGNYHEASASCMFVYALAKAGRLGYIAPTFVANARKGYDGILKNFIGKETDGTISLDKTVSVGGLGGTPYRDGSYEYYLSEPIRKNDLKGVGPFIFASIEIDIANEMAVGKGKTVALDYYFNREFRKNDRGETEQFHYTWEDQLHPGFYWWGRIYNELGAKTIPVPGKPTAASLKNANVYIIVDPDTKKETAAPNFIQPDDVKEIANWVKAGGTLILMANDTANCEIPHFNTLAQAFGITFTDKSRNMVQGRQFEQGKLTIAPGNPVFKKTRSIYIKELSTLAIKPPAKSILAENGDVIIAVANFGKGRVFAVGDPWLYNEYVDGRIIGADYENYLAAKELAQWALSK